MIFNAIFYLVAVVLGSVVLLAWLEPTVADWVIRTLYARAAGVRARRKAYRAAYLAAMQEFPQEQQTARACEVLVGSGD